MAEPAYSRPRTLGRNLYPRRPSSSIGEDTAKGINEVSNFKKVIQNGKSGLVKEVPLVGKLKNFYGRALGPAFAISNIMSTVKDPELSSEEKFRAITEDDFNQGVALETAGPVLGSLAAAASIPGAAAIAPATAAAGSLLAAKGIVKGLAKETYEHLYRVPKVKKEIIEKVRSAYGPKHVDPEGKPLTDFARERLGDNPDDDYLAAAQEKIYEEDAADRKMRSRALELKSAYRLGRDNPVARKSIERENPALTSALNEEGISRIEDRLGFNRVTYPDPFGLNSWQRRK